MRRPENQRTPYRPLIAIRLSMKGYVSEPSASVARHISPCVIPAIHMENTYSSTPTTCSQKCSSIAPCECIAGWPSARGAIA